jgi:outer membrane protein assembly factor BamB
VNLSIAIAGLAFSLVAAMPARQDLNWTDFRGPNGQGHSSSTGLPLTWSETGHIAWKTPIHGKGWSSPIIHGKQIWMTTATDDGREMFAVCVDRDTGRVLLDRKIFTNTAVDPINDVNSYASPSPAVESGRVYLHFGTYGTACVDTKSFETVWQRRDIRCSHSVGPGSSPILFGDLLILTMDGIDVQYLIALDKKTGETRWKTVRSVVAEESGPTGSMSAPERRKAFATPLLVQGDRGALLISNGAGAVYGYDPASGKELWRIRYPGGYSNSSRPVVSGETAFINTGFDKSELWAVRLGGKGDVTSSNVLWKCARNMAYKPSPLLVDGLVYVASDSGILTCLDASNGAEVWKERIGGAYSASPLYAEGRIYLFDEAGKTIVLKPGRKLEILAESRLDAGFMASPAVSGKSLILRTKTALYRIDP